jgi:hypothetical protein
LHVSSITVVETERVIPLQLTVNPETVGGVVIFGIWSQADGYERLYTCKISLGFLGARSKALIKAGKPSPDRCFG